MPKSEAQDEIIEAICRAIRTGRDANPDPDHWQFPTDCFCTDRMADYFEYDKGFLEGLLGVVTQFAATYERPSDEE